MLEVAACEDVDDCDDAAAPASRRADDGGGALSCDPPRLKVLIVDDAASHRPVVLHSLTHMARWEPHVTEAGTLDIARFCLASDDFDVVLADWDMGVAAGLALLDATAGECPVIFVGGGAQAGLFGEAIARGASVLIVNANLDEHVLEATIEQSLLQHARRASCTLDRPCDV